MDTGGVSQTTEPLAGAHERLRLALVQAASGLDPADNRAPR